MSYHDFTFPGVGDPFLFQTLIGPVMGILLISARIMILFFFAALEKRT